MSVLAQLNSLVDDAVNTQAVDMTETSKGGGFERKLLPAGKYNVRFIEYVEMGKHVPTQDGKPSGKPAVPMVRLGFMIYSGDEQVPLNPYPMQISNGEKAKLKILFDRMNAKKDIKHLAQKLGQAFSVELKVHESKAGKKSNVMEFGTLTDLPKFDPETGEPVKIPALDESMLKLFLWNKPTQETWDALKIEGTNDKGQSKNFIQEDIMKATDFVGSPLEALLFGELPQQSVPAAPAPEAPKPEAPAPEQPAPAAPTAPTAPAAPVAPVAPTAPQA